MFQLLCFRVWLNSSLVLAFLLGLTWTFGLLYLNEQTIVMAYAFTILNSLQGLFIFIFHCLQNDKVSKRFYVILILLYFINCAVSNLQLILFADVLCLPKHLKTKAYQYVIALPIILINTLEMACFMLKFCHFLCCGVIFPGFHLLGFEIVQRLWSSLKCNEKSVRKFTLSGTKPGAFAFQ